MKDSITISFWFFLCFALILGVAPADSWAATYYVATNGNDSNPGTIEQPWRTLSKAGKVGPGSTVYFRGGTYRGQLIPANSGTAGAWITFSSYPGETAYIDGTGTAVIIKTFPVNYTNLSYGNAKSYIEISNFDITSTNHGVMVEEAHHVRILNNNVHDSYHAGITAPDGTDHLLIQGNTVTGNANGVGPCGSGISVWNSGCYFGEGSSCKILNDGAKGYHIVIRDNIIYGNRNDDSNCGFPNPSDGNGIILDNNGDDNPLTLIENNLIYHNGGRCFSSLNSDNFYFINNTCWQNMQTPHMQRNGAGEITLHRQTRHGPMTFDEAVIKNNLIYGNDDACLFAAWLDTADTYEADYNLWYVANTTYMTRNCPAGGGAGYTSYDCDWSDNTNNYRSCTWNPAPNDVIRTDPLFSATATCTGTPPYNCDWDTVYFRVASNSPATDAGMNASSYGVTDDFEGNPRPQGAAYEFGAYEFLGGLASPLTAPTGLQVVDP
jgi:hypothetical protein